MRGVSGEELGGDLRRVNQWDDVEPWDECISRFETELANALDRLGTANTELPAREARLDAALAAYETASSAAVRAQQRRDRSAAGVAAAAAEVARSQIQVALVARNAVAGRRGQALIDVDAAERSLDQARRQRAADEARIEAETEGSQGWLQAIKARVTAHT